MTKNFTSVTPEALIQQYEKEMTSGNGKKNSFDIKNYLNVRLRPNEAARKVVIRILPFEPNSSELFHKVYMHQVKVNKEISESGWKNFVCPSGNDLGGECPFCKLSEEARARKLSPDTPASEKKYLDEVSFANRKRDMWVIRCIERGKEDEGVKFWMFNSSKRHDGVYDKIFNLFKQRFDSAKEKGKVNNIFDIYEGKDLILTITRSADNKTIFQVTDDEDKTPITEDEALLEKWICDPKKWTDVYPVKTYEYMSVVINGGIPIFDMESGKYVDKAELTKKTEAEKKKAEEEVANNETEIATSDDDKPLEEMSALPFSNDEPEAKPEKKLEDLFSESDYNKPSGEIDDLPF